MKRLLGLFVFLAALPLAAQVSNPGVIYVLSAPSGACVGAPPLQVVTTTGVIYTCDNGTWAAQGGGGGIGYPSGTGIAVVAGGAAWGTTLAAPVGDVVGTTDTQTLTNKTIDGVTPTTMGYVDPTSSVQTQLNAKAASNASTTVNGQTCALGGSCTVGSSLMSSVTPTNCGITGTVCITSGSVASITLATIPATYENLILTCTLQVSGTLSSGIDTVNVTFNGDTGADYNYGKYGMYGSSSIDGGHGQSSTSITGALGAQDGTLSSQWATSVLTIGRYAQTSGGKTVVGNFSQYNSGVNQVIQYQTSGNWNSGGAAITSITLTPVSGHNFAAGSRCTLDGQN